MYFKDQSVIAESDDEWYLRDECTDTINSSRKWNFTMKNRLKMQRFEQKSLFYSLVSIIHMDLVRNLTIIIFNQVLMQICTFGKNLHFSFPRCEQFYFHQIWKIWQEIYDEELSRPPPLGTGRLPNIFWNLSTKPNSWWY